MALPNLIHFLTKEFPGDTDRIREFSSEDWWKVLEVPIKYIKYAALRAPIYFVDTETIDKLCSKYCLSRETISRIKDMASKEFEGKDPIEAFDAFEREISEAIRREPEEYCRIIAVACYLRDSSKLREDYPEVSKGPAILICPERLNERLEYLKSFGIEDPLNEVLRAVFAHEVTHSYIDAWSTDQAFSRDSLASIGYSGRPNQRMDEFYHNVLEESMATAVEISTISNGDLLRDLEELCEGKGNTLLEVYTTMILKKAPAEYLGFKCLLEELHKYFSETESSLGDLVNRYSSPDLPPLLWLTALRALDSIGTLGGYLYPIWRWMIEEYEIFARSLPRSCIVALDHLYWFLYRRFREEISRRFSRRDFLKILWRSLALALILDAPTNY